MISFGHVLLSSLILGWGAAIPFGPINFEMMRRNLSFGFLFGMCFGSGVVCADLTYVTLLCMGMLSLLKHVELLRIVTMIGSFVLAWFAYQAFRAAPIMGTQPSKSTKPALQNWIEGYVFTLVNPYTILFWASVSSQLVSITEAKTTSMILASLGVVLGAFSWVCIFNGGLHFTRHKLTVFTAKLLNRIGGVILLGFAVYGLYNVYTQYT
ncbi:MAG: LysE family translocator [Legionellales bacterium]|nr:LysE family translocator [Legionellales bacterium]